MVKVRRPNKRMVVLAVSVIAGVAYFFLNTYEENMPTVQSPKHENEEADYYGEHIVFKQYSSNGRLQQSLTSEHTEHFPNAQISKFEAPLVQTTSKEGNIWQIVSRYGEVKDQDSLVTLTDDVEIQPLNAAKGEHILIETQLLHYHTEEQLATSDLPVKITGEHTVITGTGLSFLVPTEILKLNQQVKTHYVPLRQP